jgi:CspA family cold shock protein
VKAKIVSRAAHARGSDRFLPGVFQKEPHMLEGKVKWFNPRKGYGFIGTDDGRDVFVHYSSIAGDGFKTLGEGDTVLFDIAEGEKGLRATNVVPKAPSEKQPSP